MSMCVQNNINKSTTMQPKKVAVSDCAKTNKDTKTTIPTSQKIGVAVCTGLGVATSIAILAKLGKYSLNPKKILQTNWKNTYLAKAEYKTKEVITIGLGSCIGGLVGGAIFDKDKQNIKSKAQEGIAGITNIALPIAFVEAMTGAGKFISQKTMPNWLNSTSKTQKIIAKCPQVIGAMGGLGIGMFVANKVSNKINETVFKQKDNRPIKKEDFAAHADDICVAARLAAEKNPITYLVSRFIPAFLMVAGIETGNRKAK